MKNFFIIIGIIVFYFNNVSAQETEEYILLYQKNDFQKAYEVIIPKLNDIYSKRVEDKRIPSGYITLSNIGEEISLFNLFKNRREKGFFIEDNKELAQLHFYAGRCSSRLERYSDSLNHYIQSLRFRVLAPGRDDNVLFEISQVFKSFKDPVFFKGYIDALEQAYTLNPSKSSYSYEIGNALFPTKEKKKAIFHFKRYLENPENEVQPETFLKLASLYESINNYIETEKYYNEYLRIKPDDAEILFALGHLSYSKTGNYVLAESSLQRCLKIIKDGDIFRKSKSYEYLGDMAFNNLKYDRALFFYGESVKFQEKITEFISLKKGEIKNLDEEVKKMKMLLINEREFEKYEEYELLIDERNKKEKELENLKSELKRLNPGRMRWFIAVSNEKKEKYDEAIKYYREAVKYDYNPNDSRKMIQKLQLKIKRGY